MTRACHKLVLQNSGDGWCRHVYSDAQVIGVVLGAERSSVEAQSHLQRLVALSKSLSSTRRQTLGRLPSDRQVVVDTWNKDVLKGSGSEFLLHPLRKGWRRNSEPLPLPWEDD
ncbi:hypothetical protein Bbelb_420710 [Branchiostoma belcheri]|nr:hypothetical protein Bbelb_420710 [Branchiostoma belcheri]